VAGDLHGDVFGDTRLSHITHGRPAKVVEQDARKTRAFGRRVPRFAKIDDRVRIPLKVGSDSDLNPVTDSEVKLGVFGAQRRWRSYRA